jgi:hypothetical protein
MSNGPIRPSTLDGIKRYAKQLKADKGLKHAAALDAASVAGGFHNYAHARRQLEGGARRAPGHVAYITVDWRIRETNESGQETLAVRISIPLDQLVKPAHLKNARHFKGFRFAAADHLTDDFTAGSQSAARREACAAARTLVFMEATGLCPSGAGSRAYPRGSFSNVVPGHDHSSIWYDPAAKAYVFVNEPYKRGVEHISEERLAWARRHAWDIVRTTWPGMYNPDGGCELYLAADKAKGYGLARILAALDALPVPIVEADWNGESGALFPRFVSPAAKAKVEVESREPKPRRKPGMRATVSYNGMFGGNRRRPAGRMPVEAHAEVGKLLKSVLVETRNRRGVYNRISALRSDLDDWVQREHDRTELPDSRFFDLYYHEDPDADATGLTGDALRERHVQSLETAKRILTKHYPDSPPLRAMLKSADAAIKSLLTWTA